MWLKVYGHAFKPTAHAQRAELAKLTSGIDIRVIQVYSNIYASGIDTVRRVIFEGSKFRGCSINFIFASQIFAGRGMLATPTKWRLLVALGWVICRCGHAH